MSDGRYSAFTDCRNDPNGKALGMAAYVGIDVGRVPWFSTAMQTFLAPAGTTIRNVHLRGEGRTWNGDWVSALQASNDRFASSVWNVSGCTGNPGSANGCVSANRNVHLNYDFNGATGFRSVVGCANAAGCTTFSTDHWPFTRAYYFIDDLDVTLEDVSNPSVQATGGGLTSGDWMRGRQAIDFNASDNSGIRRTRFWVDDLGVINDDYRACDYMWAVPCSNLTGGRYELDTSRLSDGTHHVAADALDATDNNWSNTVHTVRVDNHAPAEPGSPSVVGGQGWHTTNDFTIQWTNPGSAAPIRRAHYEICRADGSNCTRNDTTATGITRLTGIRVPTQGEFTIRVWLEDAAGNVSSAKTNALHLKFDDVPPQQAVPQHRNGWVAKDDALDYVQRVDPPDKVPVSGIAGYAYTTSGAEPGRVKQLTADQHSYRAEVNLGDMPEGATMFKARAISGAGVPSAAVGTEVLHVDRSAPQLHIEGNPSPNQWSRAAAVLNARAVDPGQLSGMAGAEVADPDDSSGGYLTYSIDSGPERNVRGPARPVDPKTGLRGIEPSATATIPVETDGHHTVTYSATDVAGNTSAEKTVTFKIDSTAPELVVFEPQQPDDPRQITVAASDATSGLADGARIQLRRIAPQQGDWITLRATRDGQRYSARVDNTQLPAGDYQFRATVPDQAGNEAVGTRNRDGQEMVLYIDRFHVGPYRTGGPVEGDAPQRADDSDHGSTVATQITAGIVRKERRTRRKCKTVRVRGRKRKRCQRVPVGSPTERLVRHARRKFGARTATKGRLTTSDGRPLANVEVAILARPDAEGAVFAAEGAVRTNANGEFRYTAPAGPSRELAFSYRGDSTHQRASDSVTLEVPAAVTIKASRRTVRNGKSVTFTGKLRGKPYPAKGKLIDLQAFYRGKWRTFATPRAKRNGRWRRRYRFEATRGQVTYKFRARVGASSDYPYATAYSRTVKVKVRGR